MTNQKGSGSMKRVLNPILVIIFPRAAKKEKLYAYVYLIIKPRRLSVRHRAQQHRYLPMKLQYEEATY